MLQYEDGVKTYIIAPMGVQVGDKIGNGAMSTLRPGNSRALKEIPLGTVVHNIEMRPGKGGPARPFRRHIGADPGNRRQVCHTAAAKR